MPLGFVHSLDSDLALWVCTLGAVIFKTQRARHVEGCAQSGSSVKRKAWAFPRWHGKDDLVDEMRNAAVSAAGSRGVPPRFPNGSETLPELAGEEACATWDLLSSESFQDSFVSTVTAEVPLVLFIHQPPSSL